MIRITIEAIQAVAAMKWDVDISDSAAAIMLPEAQEFTWQLEKEYQRDVRAERYYLQSIGESTDDIAVEAGDRREGAIMRFLYPILGQPCGFDDEDKFVRSEYVQQNGMKFGVENLPKKNWKTAEEITAPTPRKRKSRTHVDSEPISENLQKLNDKLLIAGCPSELVEKFRDQLEIIAECGFETSDILVAGNQTMFSLVNGSRELTVDLIRPRCAIRLFGGKTIEKIYAHRKADVRRAVEWLGGRKEQIQK